MTARIDTAVARAIAVIGDHAWQPIPYLDAVDDDDGLLVASSAEVGETVYTAFTSTEAPVTARLVVWSSGRPRPACRWTSRPSTSRCGGTTRCSPTATSR